MISKSNIFIELLFQAWDNESKAGKYRYISLAQVKPPNQSKYWWFWFVAKKQRMMVNHDKKKSIVLGDDDGVDDACYQ